MTLVITHYDKDYDWAKELSIKHNIKLYVYDKKTTMSEGKVIQYFITL